MNLKINHLQHVGIPVSSLDHSTEFYKRLGFRPVMQSGFPHEGGEGSVTMMELGSIKIELYQLPEPGLSSIRQRGDGRIDHIAFDVDEIGETFRTVKEAGFHPFEEAPVFLPFWTYGCRYFNIAGPDGERLEFCQILKEAPGHLERTPDSSGLHS